METEKSKMTEYLEKFQMLQRMVQGIADATLTVTSVKAGIMLKFTVTPLDESYNIKRTKTGKLIWKGFDISEWFSDEDNQKQLSLAKKYIDSLL